MMLFMVLNHTIILLLYIVLFLVPLQSAHAIIDQAGEFLKPDSAKECAICHYLWVDTFFIEQTSTEFADLPAEPSVADAEMCFSCHDGSTIDSRKQVFNDRMHQVGIIPSKKIKIPEIFPLDSDGKMTCGTCHSAHGVSTEPGIEKTIFLRTSHEDSQMCTMCHVDKIGGPDRGNHPVGKDTIIIPEEVTNSGGYVGRKPNQVICESCHIAHGGFTDKRLVLPVDRPDRYPVLCETCHGKTPGLHKHPETGQYSHSVDVIPENARIPDTWGSGVPVRLGDQGGLLCITCHMPHQAPGKEFLLAGKNTQGSFCLRCHSSQQEAIKGTKHDLGIMAPDEKNIVGQSVSESGLCGSCHLVHQGTGPFMWARPLEGRQNPFVEICSSCHAESRCAAEVPVPASGHPTGVTPDNKTDSMDFPLYADTGITKKQGSVYCSSCHNSHQWEPGNPDNKGTKKEHGNETNSFLRATVNRNSALCFGCHKSQASIEKTDHDFLHSGSKESNSKEQFPLQSGVCGVCHLPHGGETTYMWARKIGNKKDDLMARFCLECHSADGCAPEKQVGIYSHPVGGRPDVNVNKVLPLFTQQSKEDPSGMIFCSTCHNPHQWNPVDPEKKGEEGTGEDSFLRKSSAADAPLCTGCHEEKSFVIGTEHDLRVSASADENSTSVFSQQSGVCGSCHGVHNGRTPSYLWNRDEGPEVINTWNPEFVAGYGMMISLCTGCHRSGDCAGKKVPEYGLHPKEEYRILFKEDNDTREKVMEAFPP